MDISVIISNFNGEKYIQRLLKSLRAQKNVSLEIIVVDRGSTDKSLQFLSEEPGIKLISHPAEFGLVAGYARGFQIATKRLIFLPPRTNSWVI
jgi:glycosyltransferase involved in cell wall biosynthesis